MLRFQWLMHVKQYNHYKITEEHSVAVRQTWNDHSSTYSSFHNKSEIEIFSMKWLIVCSCHVTYTFQIESTLHICLNVKELLARSRREI